LQQHHLASCSLPKNDEFCHKKLSSFPHFTYYTALECWKSSLNSKNLQLLFAITITLLILLTHSKYCRPLSSHIFKKISRKYINFLKKIFPLRWQRKNILLNSKCLHCFITPLKKTHRRMSTIMHDIKMLTNTTIELRTTILTHFLKNFYHQLHPKILRK
jgi:hypothetical protein